LVDVDRKDDEGQDRGDRHDDLLARPAERQPAAGDDDQRRREDDGPDEADRHQRARQHPGVAQPSREHGAEADADPRPDGETDPEERGRHGLRSGPGQPTDRHRRGEDQRHEQSEMNATLRTIERLRRRQDDEAIEPGHGQWPDPREEDLDEQRLDRS